MKELLKFQWGKIMLKCLIEGNLRLRLQAQGDHRAVMLSPV